MSTPSITATSISGILNLLLQAKPVNERLRHIGGSAKLVLDILEFDAGYERAFLSICG